MAAPPRFSASEKPRDIINTAGLWLAMELGAETRWVPSSHSLKLAVGPGITAEVELRGSKWNLTGVLTHASVEVHVRDRALSRWRRSLGRKWSGFVTESGLDVLWSHLLLNIYPDLRDLELFGDVGGNTGSGRQYLTLVAFRDALRTRIVPKLLMFESPARAASELPDAWLADAGQMEDWATSHGDEESARLLATRREKFFRRLPPDSDLEAVLAAGRELLEKLQSERVHFREYRDGNLSDELVREGHKLARGWVAALSDPAGRIERVPDGALTRWASTNLGPASPIRQKAIDFETAAMRTRSERR